jgi:ribosome recycling factor
MSFNFSDFDNHVEDTVDWLETELGKIRSGRVSSGILNDITVSVYGSETPLEQLASIGNEGPRTLRVDVYDASQIDQVETAIQMADLGASIMKDSSGLRLNFPEMTEENRKEAMERAESKQEEAKISLRKEREKTLKQIESAESEGDISEDQMHRQKEKLEDKMQKAKDRLNQLIEDKREALET